MNCPECSTAMAYGIYSGEKDGMPFARMVKRCPKCGRKERP